MVGIFRRHRGVSYRIERHSSCGTNDDCLHRLQAGDERALGELADTYGSKIYQLAFRYLRNKEDAEEVTQDVLFKVYRKVGAFRGDAALSSWIYRITFNAAMSRLRTAKHQRSARSDERGDRRDSDEPAASRAELADWSDLADEQVLRVAAAAARVPRDPRAAGDLPGAGHAARLQGMSTEEASAHAAGEGSDAQVAAASRPADPAQAARGLRRRPDAAPARLD